MALKGVAHGGQHELARCEVTDTSTASGESSTEVISRPSGKRREQLPSCRNLLNLLKEVDVRLISNPSVLPHLRPL
jgi:hypothetical protein